MKDKRFDFEHYLKAGHGRAYLMAEKEPERYRDAIMDACRKDYTFDIQCEGSRAFLTSDLIDLFEDQTPFIDAAKDAFNSSQIDDVYNEIQYLSDLLMEFGQKKTVLDKYLALWEKIKKTPYSHLTERSSYLLFNVEYLAIKLVCDQPWKIAENIVKDMGAWYLTLEDDARSEFPWFYSVLEEEYGEDETRGHLIKLAEESPEAKAFCDKDLRKEPLSQGKVTSPKNTPTAADVVELLRSSKDLRELDLLHMGVRRMKEDEIRKLARSAVDTDSNAIRERIVSVFNTKRRFTWPLGTEYLVKWCNERDADLLKACHSAMTFIEDEHIREYALTVLRQGFDADCLMMLIRNFQSGDEAMILSLLEQVTVSDEDDCRWHDIVSVILDSYKKLPLSILLWAYEATLCSCCRMHLIEDLIELGALSEEIRNECMWDADLEIRELVAGKGMI
ncbi:MAG: hypothetical protein J5685_01840 [Clostridiales bacterium]|nr:hypothetical protein [Clostridiales bacterium]